MPAETTPHDYEPGDRTDEMQTDPDCRICGKPNGALIHGLGGWGNRRDTGPGVIIDPPAHVTLRRAGEAQAKENRK